MLSDQTTRVDQFEPFKLTRMLSHASVTDLLSGPLLGVESYMWKMVQNEKECFERSTMSERSEVTNVCAKFMWSGAVLLTLETSEITRQSSRSKDYCSVGPDAVTWFRLTLIIALYCLHVEAMFGTPSGAVAPWATLPACTML